MIYKALWDSRENSTRGDLYRYNPNFLHERIDEQIPASPADFRRKQKSLTQCTVSRKRGEDLLLDMTEF